MEKQQYILDLDLNEQSIYEDNSDITRVLIQHSSFQNPSDTSVQKSFTEEAPASIYPQQNEQQYYTTQEASTSSPLINDGQTELQKLLISWGLESMFPKCIGEQIDNK